MKTDSKMTESQWKNSLFEVWNNAKDFEEILTFGLEHNFISSSDIIHASDIYKDPDKEYDDEEIKEMIKSTDIYDLINMIVDVHSIQEIINCLDTDDIMQLIGNDEMLDYLDGTYELDDHDDKVRTKYYDEVIDELATDLEKRYKERYDNISNLPSDDLHRFLCDIVGCSYYESTVIEQLKEKAKNNNYIENYK